MTEQETGLAELSSCPESIDIRATMEVVARLMALDRARVIGPSARSLRRSKSSVAERMGEGASGSEDSKEA